MKGLERGRAEGRVEVKKATKVAIAQPLLNQLPLIEISRITGLTVEEIEAATAKESKAKDDGSPSVRLYPAFASAD